MGVGDLPGRLWQEVGEDELEQGGSSLEECWDSPAPSSSHPQRAEGNPSSSNSTDKLRTCQSFYDVLSFPKGTECVLT